MEKDAPLPSLYRALLLLAASALTVFAGPSAPTGTSLQAQLDENPGKLVHVPAGDHVIREALRIRSDGSGLYGEGRIVQENENAAILIVEGARDVTVRHITLTRSAGHEETTQEGLLGIKCRDLVVEGVQVINNRTRSAAIAIRESQQTELRHCRVRNYMRITIDDRTQSKDWGYAFKCIDGTGIAVSYSQGTRIAGCRVIEEDLLPTREIQQKFELGKFVKKNPEKGLLIGQQTWDAEFVSNWHQGSGIIVTAPESSAFTRISDNSIENAAQGVDLHSDHVIMSGNVINNSFMGMKAMHGSRNVIITGNQFIKNDLWSIGLMPGASSHPPAPAADGKPAALPNVDGGSVIANNIISDFGRGHSAWVWGGQGTPIRFDSRQKPHNPPLKDVVIQGNVIYDTEKDEIREAGAPENPARYEYAVRIADEVRGLHFTGNVFHPGRQGVSNLPLTP